MKPILIIFLAAILFSGCHTSKNVTSVKQKAVIAKDKDSTQYEVLIFDPDFDFWYQVHFNSVLDYTNEYYRTQNTLAVVRWNSYYTSGRYYRIIENYLDYDNNTDYGIDINRKLYWYFKYVQEQFHLRLLK